MPRTLPVLHDGNGQPPGTPPEGCVASRASSNVWVVSARTPQPTPAFGTVAQCSYLPEATFGLRQGLVLLGDWEFLLANCGWARRARRG